MISFSQSICVRKYLLTFLEGSQGLKTSLFYWHFLLQASSLAYIPFVVSNRSKIFLYSLSRLFPLMQNTLLKNRITWARKVICNYLRVFLTLQKVQGSGNSFMHFPWVLKRAWSPYTERNSNGNNLGYWKNAVIGLIASKTKFCYNASHWGKNMSTKKESPKV